MSEETTKAKNTRGPDDAVRVLSIQFHGSRDLPPVTGKFGGEQAITRLGTGERGEHRYEITFHPRFGLYVVKVFKLPTDVQVAEYLIPREWAIASLEVKAAKADPATEAGSAKLGA